MVTQKAFVLRKKEIKAGLWKALKFVLTARDREKNTYRSLDCLKVEKDTLICTDGCRLHIAYLPHDLEEGLFLVEKCNGTEILLIQSKSTFPKWQDIVPQDGRVFTVDPRRNGAAGNCSDSELDATEAAYVYATHGVCIRTSFFQDAGLHGEYHLPVESAKSNTPIKVIAMDGGCKKVAVLMPLKTPSFTLEPADTKKMSSENAKAVHDADQGNARMAEERAKSSDGLTASERAMTNTD